MAFDTVAVHFAWCLPCARLGAGRGARADADVDGRLLLEQLLTDVLIVHARPAWPAALPALLRLLGGLAGSRGLFSPDNAVRQAAVDALGQVAAQLCYEARVAERDASDVAAILADEGASPAPQAAYIVSVSCASIQRTSPRGKYGLARGKGARCLCCQLAGLGRLWPDHENSNTSPGCTA